ncbi:biliverdin-producing heme oxygenase [Novosphingobium sp. JCM 18896]|uniref:biliverdin-producing heme oxygenase n=1 Tax=Novosphingobium sp. JCM 18896 TaxID=2989731 RepID=UPI002221D21D|nr:biliverdin-producing heme oxygenase [Novosphingobium sp. JCM 18896]MCW1431460.1 biliverdin-producing heme oxygenase [Novosphingobium sp. JCM 18896]
MQASQTDSAVAHLRAATRVDHEQVDAAYGRFALDTRDGYRDFLTAHARILPLAERLIDPGALVEGWHGRTQALHDDLAALGGEAPPELDFALPPGAAARWGALYVIEGSRLGGAVLARSVPEGLPAAYLGARHGSGGWRDLLARLETAIGDEYAKAEAGAKAMFGAYLEAARR